MTLGAPRSVLFSAPVQRCWAWACLTLLAWAGAPHRALAHPRLDAAIALAEEADFERSLRAFEAALSSQELTRDELIALLSQRALVLHALGRNEPLARDLSLLAALAPDHSLGRSAPPALLRKYEAARSGVAPLQLKAECQPAALSLHLQTLSENVPESAGAQLALYARTGQQDWALMPQPEAQLSGPGPVAYYAELRGLGGVLLANAGSRDAPLTCAVPQAAPPQATQQADTDEARQRRRRWWWIAGSGAALVVVGVTAAVLATRSSDSSEQTAVGRPMVSF